MPFPAALGWLCQRIRLGRAAVECRDIAVRIWQRHTPSRLRRMGLCSLCKQKTFQLSHNICPRRMCFFFKKSPTGNQTMPAGFSVALSNTCCNWIAIGGIPAWGGFGGPLPWLAAPSGGTCQMLAKVSGGRGPGLQKQAGVSKLETARSCTVGLILLTLASRVKP